MNNRFKKLLPLIGAIVVAVLAFIFFQWLYPYHLFRREQTMMFLMDNEFISRYFEHPGWLSNLAGDFLTQFFYYVGIGPLIIALLLGLLWLTSYLYAQSIVNRAYISAIFATLISAWEFMRECAQLYTLSSTISLLAAMAIAWALCHIKSKWLNAIFACLIIAISYWCFGYGAYLLAALILIMSIADRNWISCAIAILAVAVMPKAVLTEAMWWGKPNFRQEHKLAIDSEAYFGNRDKVLQLSLQGPNTRYASFYYYLVNALSGQLPDALTQRMPKDAEALLPTMDSSKGSIDLSALGEAWFYMGDMTAAEHCTIVAMISSVNYTGTRYLRRLAEINLANGDTEAAAKYLRLLSKTLCHRKWAQKRLAEGPKALSGISRYASQNDTVRYVNDYVKSMRHLVQEHPDNYMAYDYLLCTHLLRRDLKSFMDDLVPERVHPRLYQEAILAALAITQASVEETQKYGIPQKTFEDFYKFNQMMPLTPDNNQQVAARFGNTYWYYYQLSQL